MRGQRALIGVLLLAAALRAIVAFSASDEAFLDIDGRDYRELAVNLAAGRGYSVSYYRWFEPVPAAPEPLHPDLYRPPLLPLLGAGLCRLPGDWFVWARLVAVLTGCALVLALYALAKSLFGRAIALTVALALALYPYAIYYSARWITESLFGLCVATALALLAAAAPAWRPRTLLLAGIALGLASLARPTGLLFIAGLVPLGVARAPRAARLRTLALLLAGSVIVLTPWTLRNHAVTGRANPGTFFGAYNAWLGMNPRMYEMYRAGDSPRFAHLMDELYRVDLSDRVHELERRGIYEIGAIEDYWRRQTLDFVRREPAEALYILGQRALHFWRPWPNRATVSASRFWVSTLVLVPVMVTAAFAAVRCRRARSPWLLAPLLITFAASLPFVFHLRFRFPTGDPYLIVIAIVGAEAWVRRRRPAA
jgi:4-amino-4-deoxy-L-arabinose transferase-like glycosyltransferase